MQIRSRSNLLLVFTVLRTDFPRGFCFSAKLYSKLFNLIHISSSRPELNLLLTASFLTLNRAPDASLSGPQEYVQYCERLAVLDDKFKSSYPR